MSASEPLLSSVEPDPAAPRPAARGTRDAIRPWLGGGGRRTVVLTALVATGRALALVVFADALTRGIVTVVGHSTAGTDLAAGELSPTLLVAGLAAVARALLEWAGRALGARGALLVGHELRGELLRAAVRTGAGPASTSLLAGARLDELQELFVRVVPAVVGTAVVPLVVGARVLSLDLLSAVVLALTIPLVPVFLALVGQHTQQAVDRASGALDRLSGHLVELARGLPVLVGLGRLEDQLAALDDVDSAHRVATMRSLRVAFLSALVLELISTISVAVVAVFVGVRLVHGELPLEVGLLVLVLAPECYTPFRELGVAFHASRAGLGALREAREVVDTPAPREHRGAGAAGSTLVIRELRVTYPGRSTPALEVDGARIRGGAITLVAAASGGGKSTLLAAIVGRAGADAQVAGSIAGAGGRDVAWMPQAPSFAGSTPREELLLLASGSGAEPEAAPASRSESARSRDAVDTLLARAGLPRRLADAELLELSPGERRRLAFARVLARIDDGADLVVLDEPTAHLDDEAAGAVLDELRLLRGVVTVVVASHDPRVLELVDEVLSLDGTAPEAVARSERVAPAASSPSFHGAGRADDGRAEQHPDAERPTPERRPDPDRVGARVRLRDILRPAASRLIAGAVVAAAATASAAALTALSGWLIVRASEQPPIMYLLVAIVGVRFFGIARSVLRYSERLLVHDAVLRMAGSLRLRLWRALGVAGPTHRRLLSGPSVVDGLIVAPDAIRDAVPRVVVPPLAALIAVGGAVLTTSLLLPGAAAPLAVVLVAGLVLAPAAALLADGATAAATVRLRSQAVLRSATILAAVDELAVHGAASRLIDRVLADDLVATRAARRSALAQGLASAIAVATSLTAALLSLVVVAGDPSAVAEPAVIAVLALLPLALVEPLQSAAESVRLAPTLRTAMRSLPRVLPSDLPLRADDASRRARAEHGVVPALEMDDVTVGWPGDSRPVVSGVSASVARGGRLVIAGPSGSGKSTLLAVALGQLAPRRGEYRLDGAAVLTGSELAGRVAWAPQESHVFAGSIRANLLLARPRAERPDDDELVAALDTAGLGLLVRSLPEGLSTPVGAGGAALSGGERQRLAVARALLTDAPVLLLDEPTAHLDAPTAAALRSDLAAATRDRALVVVSHDVAETTDADAVLRLDGRGGGRLEEPPLGDFVPRRNTMFTSGPTA